ncbi:MAG TPA: divalent metal cation transporter [Candidatus Paceibacterota bacterium]
MWIKKIWNKLGSGLITGVADDEPSAIATYAIAGSKFGLAMLWVSLFSLPFMIAIQEMSGRIGRVSGRGLAGNMKRFYPKPLVFLIALLVVSVNTVNIGADMSAMAHSLSAIFSFPEKASAIVMTLIILGLVVLLPYQKIFTIFKWTALSLFAYVFTTFTVHQDWPTVLRHLVVPQIILSKEFFFIFIAFFGTTISPYLFFWQANQEVEERIIEQCKPGQICRLKPIISEKELKSLRLDTRIGMSFSNIITFFIIVLTSSTLFRAGINDIESLADMASALKPLAGDYAQILFTFGIVSSGFLAIPVLAGSAAYVVAEVFGWSEGLTKTFTKAKEFYGVIIASTLVGLLIPLLGFHPVKALLYTSIFYGLISPIVIFMIIHMANNKKIMGKNVNSRPLNVMGHLTFCIMLFLALTVFFVLPR